MTQQVAHYNLSKSDYELLYKEFERQIVKKLLENSQTLQNDSLNLSSLTEMRGEGQKQDETPKVQSIRERMRARRARLLAASASSDKEHAGDPKEHKHDTTNEDLALFMLMCMVVG